MKVVFTYPQWTSKQKGIIKFFSRKVGVVPPLGLAYLAALTENAGHEVLIIDAEAEGLNIEQVIEKLKQFRPDIIGVTATTTFFHESIRSATCFKSHFPDIPICIGGAHVTILKEKAFDSCFDFAFIGESEISWINFLEAHQNASDYSSVSGLIYRDKDRVIINDKLEIVMDLDTLPNPAWHLLKSEAYLLRTPNGKLKRVGTIFTTRGCPFKCIFCSTELSGSKIRTRKPEKVVEEIEMLVSQFDIEHIMFLDETFTMNRNHIMEICRLLINKNLNITFEAGTRADLLDEELIKTMAKTGFVRLGFGLESVDPKIRSIARKGISIDAYITANKLALKYKIQTRNSCIIGLPGETKKTIRDMLRFLRKHLEMQIINMTIATPYPGTELYQIALQGKHNVHLCEHDFSKYRRYGSPVLKVGDLTPQDLLRYQNDAYVSIYMHPARWRSMIGAYGLSGFFSHIDSCHKGFSKNHHQ